MKVVGIHGMQHQYLGPNQIRNAWLPAINDGLAFAGAEKLPSRDFEVVSYGQLSRGGNDRADTYRGDDEIDLADLRETDLSPAEREVFALIWDEAARLSRISTDPEKDEDDSIQDAKTEGRATSLWIQNCVDQITKSRFIRGFGPQRLLPFLREVFRFLSDRDFKQRVLARVKEVISGETQVLVGHSLGSIVAYEALCANPDWKVDTFVSLGSPLGIRNYVFDALTPRPTKDRGVWPNNIKHWVNIADKGDIVALQKQLALLFGPVEDKVVYNGWRSHDICRYLSAKETGSALRKGLLIN